jgi:hypothetical protein
VRIVARGAASFVRRRGRRERRFFIDAFHRETPEIFTFDTSRLIGGFRFRPFFPLSGDGRLFFFAVAPSRVPGHASDRI